jgi:hypothetical protein
MLIDFEEPVNVEKLNYNLEISQANDFVRFRLEDWRVFVQEVDAMLPEHWRILR